jgi:hypothetical protein
MRASAHGVVLLLVAALAGCATEAPPADAPTIVTAHPIMPYDSHEECTVLAVGDRLDLSWSSTEAVDFDIRYRERGATLMPVAREKAFEYSTIFAPSIAQRYCLAWEAGRFGALVDFRYQVRRAK